MIVASMTEDEIKKEVLDDLKNAFKWEDLNQNKFRRLVIKSSKFPIYKHYSYKSPRKNNWLILLEARSKKEYGDYSRVTYIVTYDSPHGIYAIMVMFKDAIPHLAIYPPHFFKRYRERMQLDVTGIDLMVEYFRYNSNFTWKESPRLISDTHYVTEVGASTADGVSLGIRSIFDNFLLKTFVTYDMLKDQQFEEYTKNEKIRQEIHGII